MVLLNQKGIAHLVLVVGIIAVSVVGLAGWRIYDINQDKKVLFNSSDSQDSKSEQLPIDINGIKTIEEITALTEQQNNDAQISVIELEQEDSGLMYKVRLKDGRVLIYNAMTGQLVASESEDPSDRDSIPSGFVASINIFRAKEIAQETYPNKTVKKIEFELEDGVMVYSVRFTDGSRVDVNAANGEIVRNKAENQSESQEDKDTNDDNDSQESRSSGSNSSSSNGEQEDMNDDNGTDDNSGSNSGSDDNDSEDSSDNDSKDESDKPDDSDNR